ncbi:hypothetical protein [Streptomyces tauricus]|uniref:hypothetical protein n=1 Tax=Streptomyces tauricus TaxID=68274 RepID=UPI00224320DC|nr:hypothetical protein [Streptomyces tauricus]MCW8102716.1 hypothetical protein [Streptomyces tauricus]
MPCPLLAQVRHALLQAGFPLVAQSEDDGRPGLSVTEVPAGVLVAWTASDEFTALTKDKPGTSGDRMHELVQAAVSGLLLQQGHTVTEPAAGADLLILAGP